MAEFSKFHESEVEPHGSLGFDFFVVSGSGLGLYVSCMSEDVVCVF